MARMVVLSVGGGLLACVVLAYDSMRWVAGLRGARLLLDARSLRLEMRGFYVRSVASSSLQGGS